MPLETGAKLKRSKYHRICGEIIYVYLLGWVAIRTYYYVTTISTLAQEPSCSGATIVRPSYDLRMDRINTRSWLTAAKVDLSRSWSPTLWLPYSLTISYEGVVSAQPHRAIWSQDSRTTATELGKWNYFNSLIHTVKKTRHDIHFRLTIRFSLMTLFYGVRIGPFAKA